MGHFSLLLLSLFLVASCGRSSEEEPRKTVETPAPNEKSSGDSDEKVKESDPRPEKKDEEISPVDQTKRWIGMNDISVLFPLDAVDALIRPDFAGTKGALLPLDIFAQIPASHSDSVAERYARVRLLAVRFDPCFPRLLQDLSQCAAVIRMVWQSFPAKPGFPGSLEAISEDVSFHSFYSLSQEEWKVLVKGLADLRSASGIEGKNLALGINPALKSEGLSGPYAQSLRKLIGVFAGQKNLSEVAFMQLLAKGTSWNFGSFVKQGSAFQLKVIPTLDQIFEQNLTARNFGSIVLNYSEGPAGKSLKTLAVLNGVPSAEQRAAAEVAIAIENPGLHNPSSVDCISCHIAPLLRYPLKSSDFPELLSSPGLYTNPGQNISQLYPPSEGINLRAFGYFGKNPSISQRTINESAALADFVNKSYLNP